MTLCRNRLAVAVLVAVLALGLFASDGDLQPPAAHAQTAISPGVSATPIDLIVYEGTSEVYTVALGAQPSTRVTVTVNDPLPGSGL